MRGIVRNADVIVLYGLRLLCWCCCAEVSATGGALDSGASFQGRSAPLGTGTTSVPSAPPAAPTTTQAPPSAKMTAFSGSFTDGLAQAVAHDAAQSSELFREFIFSLFLPFIIFIWFFSFLCIQ